MNLAQNFYPSRFRHKPESRKSLIFWSGLLFLVPAKFLVAQSTVTTSTNTLVTTSTGVATGVPLDIRRGPWVIGDVRFMGNVLSDIRDLQLKVRAHKGILYTPEDIDSDVAALMDTGFFLSVTPSLYAMTDQPVSPGFATIAISTSQVRLVFALSEKAAPSAAQTVGVSSATTTAGKPPAEPPPAAISGVVLTPTAYRGLGHFNRPGLGLDFNAVYYIGRLYGKNGLSYTLDKTNYLDRIGFWILSADGKMQLQSEGKWRPAVAAGTQGMLTFRDSPQPAVTTPSVSVTVSQKTTRILTDAYFVMSKNFWGARASAGFMEGNVGDVVANLTEFLSPESLTFGGHPGQTAQSKSVFFLSLLTLPKPAYPLAVEFFKPNGMVLNPWLLNFKLGYFFHLNFDVSYLKFQGGYDLLGNFQFRFNFFPSR